MRLFRILLYSFYHRRHRKYYLCLLICFILILSSTKCYWCTEKSSQDNRFELDEKKTNEFRKDMYNSDFKTSNPILLKYIGNPYNIDVWSIINEANRKYRENNHKYLVYSCPFMCGGKILENFVFNIY